MQLDNFPKKLPPDNQEYVYRNCIVEQIYDGDTVRLTIDFGFGLTQNKVTFRLYGIDTPEMRGSEREDGVITRDWLRTQTCIEGTEFDGYGFVTNGIQNLVTIQTIPDPTYTASKGKYGRYLIILWDDDGNNLNHKMVDKGLAQKIDY